MKIEKIKVDSKGRIVLPLGFRTTLGIKEGDYIFASIDEVNSAIIVSPLTEKKPFVMDIVMADKPGTLAKLATVLAENKVDLISSRTHSLIRQKEAAWHVICVFRGATKAKVRSALKKAGALKVDIRRA